MSNRKINNAVLDLIEERFIKGLLGEIDDIPAATLEILRRVLHENGRITAPMEGFTGDESLGDIPERDSGEVLPFPRKKMSEYK